MAISDREDYHLLELAKQVKADYILTNDKKVLGLESWGKTEIMRFVDFYNQLDLLN